MQTKNQPARRPKPFGSVMNTNLNGVLLLPVFAVNRRNICEILIYLYMNETFYTNMEYLH